MNYKNIKATIYSVGDWDGNEQLAADNINRIYKAILNAVDNDFNQDRLDDIIHYVWDDWGSEEKLLKITDEDIKMYVEKVL